MDDTELAQLKAQLLKLRANLDATTESTTEASRPVELDQASVGRLSRMDAMRAQNMAQEAGRRREAQLARIAGALRRMQSGDFGQCFVCGEDIELRRLRFDPTTTRCVRCKQD